MTQDRLVIKAPEGNIYLTGEAIATNKETPEEVSGKIQASYDPYFDYFILQDKGLSYIFKANASDFSASTLPHGLQSLYADSTAVRLEGAPDAKIYRIYDRGGGYPEITDIKVELDSAGRGLKPHEQRLQKAVSDLVIPQLMGKSPSYKEIMAVLGGALGAVQSYCWDLDPEFVFTPSGTGPGKVELTIRFTPAPDTIVIEGLSDEKRRELLDLLTKQMASAFDGHQIVKERRRSTSVGELLYSEGGNGKVSWQYPKDVPGWDKSSKLVELFREQAEGVSSISLPPLAPYAKMPIPLNVFNSLKSWLAQVLYRVPGRHPIESSTTNGVFSVRVKNDAFPTLHIAEEAVRQTYKETGIDLAKERLLLEEGTTDWSHADLDRFINNLAQRFREGGFDLLIAYPGFLFKAPDNNIWVRPFYTKLIAPAKVTISGDVDLEGTLTPEEINAKIASKPVTRSEVYQGLQDIFKSYQGAGYLLAGDLPGDERGRGIRINPADDDGLDIYIELARFGEIVIKGDIPESSKAEVKKELESFFTTGRPFQTKEFYIRLSRILKKLALQAESEPLFTYSSDGLLKITLSLKRTDGKYFIGGGYGVGTGPSLATGIVAPHRVPGTTSVSAGTTLGEKGQGLSLAATTLPINSDGHRISTSISGFNHAYNKDLSSKGGGLSVTYHLPLDRLSGPWELQFTGRTSGGSAAINSDEADQGPSSNLYVGGQVALSYVSAELLTHGDLISMVVSSGVDGDTINGNTDAVFSIEGVYQYPLLKNLYLEVAGGAVAHQPIEGNLPPKRQVWPGQGPRDFAQGINDPISGKQAAIGANTRIVYKEKDGLFSVINPYVGASIVKYRNTDGPPDKQGKETSIGAAVGIEVPSMGLDIYMNNEGNFGLGMAWITEF